MYRGGEGMWSWILHRVTGIGIFLFLLVHVFDTFLLLFGPEVYNYVIGMYATPAFRVGEVFLIAAVLYHSLNGLRITIIDFWSEGWRYQRQMFWAEIVVVVLIMIPMTYILLAPIFV